jgi:hypothetical protein
MSAADADAGPHGARRAIIQTYAYREDAERAVDWLWDQGFAVDRVSIIGVGPSFAGRVAGWLAARRAALIGAGQGATIGLVLGLVFSLFFRGVAFFGVLLCGLVSGALIGAFSSVAGTGAGRYEVQIDEGVAGEAQELFDALPVRSQAGRSGRAGP